MPNRSLDPHHHRDAVHIQPDAKVIATEHVFQAIADGRFDERRRAPELPAADRRPAPAPRSRPEHDPRDREWIEDAAVLQSRLRRSRVMPDALRVPCPEHQADPAVPCWGRAGQSGSAVCMGRVMRGKALALPQPVAENPDWLRRQAERERSSERLRVRATDAGTEPWPLGERRRNRSWNTGGDQR